MAQEAWRAYLELALGATEATRKKATKTVKRLAGKGAVSAEQLQTMVEDLLRTGSTNREALTGLVRYELERALNAVGLATAEEVGALTARVRDLEAKLRTAAVQPVPAVPPAAPAKVAKKAVKKAVPGPLHEVDAPRSGDVDLGASEPAVPPVAAVKTAAARKRVAKTTVSTAAATTAAVADAAAGPTPTDAVPVKAAKASPAKAAKAAATRRPATKAPARKAAS